MLLCFSAYPFSHIYMYNVHTHTCLPFPLQITPCITPQTLAYSLGTDKSLFEIFLFSSYIHTYIHTRILQRVANVVHRCIIRRIQGWRYILEVKLFKRRNRTRSETKRNWSKRRTNPWNFPRKISKNNSCARSHSVSPRRQREPIPLQMINDANGNRKR